MSFGQETLLNLLFAITFSTTCMIRQKSLDQRHLVLKHIPVNKIIQLEYTDAKESLLQAARKVPTIARGFRIQCKKWAIIVRLLLGEIPHRTVFMQKGMKKALTPYFELTNAERVGDLELFRAVADKFASTFSADNIFCILLMGYGSFVGYVLCNKI